MQGTECEDTPVVGKSLSPCASVSCIKRSVICQTFSRCYESCEFRYGVLPQLLLFKNIYLSPPFFI